jgi:UDP-N-acetyl-D-galactosamine dehydrogenase
MFDIKKCRVAVIGLGYVGMPLALMLAKHLPVAGFDVSETRVNELKDGIDRNREIKQDALRATRCHFTTKLDDIRDANVYIVTVPTPIDANNKPDMMALKSASKTVGQVLKKNDIVVYESTVYPGVTEDICGAVLENESGLKSGTDFFLGYSPERINPGDAEHTVQNIVKVVSGQTPDVADYLAKIYGLVNNGKIFVARNIKTAEAAKVIENAQRDINVAFINEVTMILNKLDLSAHEVLEAARTKWNFLPFTPGLVGGHCIGVDPYYLSHCSQNLGHEPEVILAGRKINDNMGRYVAERLDGAMAKRGRILLLGFTFKENINDIRNTKVMDIIAHLESMGHQVDVHDPHAIPEEVKHEYGRDILKVLPSKGDYDAVGLLVAHESYRGFTAPSVNALIGPQAVVFDLKGIWRPMAGDLAGTYTTL